MTKNQLLIRLLVFASIPVLLGSCDLSRKYEKAEEAEIAFYLKENATTIFIKKPSGLYYHEALAGTGATPGVADTAYIKYSASFIDGEVFDSNMETTDTLALAVGVGDVIEGFDEAISYMKVDGISKFIVPSFLGYGNSGYYFPAYTPIIYEVKLAKVLDMPASK